MTLGGLLLILLIVAIVPIYFKVKEHSEKLKKLEGTTKKLE
ncbi:unnamed protein product [marine sediment metagenome]|uniref:Uncharacterized protein n=1 Tax=marine sediment metagenome TaxID=412755 RepID=X1DDG8_9ZZZZ